MDVTPIGLLMLFPILTVIVMKVWRAQNYTWLESGTQVVLTFICITAFYMGGKYSEMSATEYWTGSITQKTYEDDWYQTSYCCSTDKDGNCNRTCYDDHYTREWFLKTTVGKIRTSYIDTEWRTRRDNFESDWIWNEAYIGQACSRPNTYLNYVQAAKFSLHHRSGSTERFAKAGLLPNCPKLHHKYRLDRVIDLGVGISNIDEWRLILDDYMKVLGASKQINIFVLFVPTDDPGYTAALEAHWLGANKNDTIIIVGMTKDTKIINMVDVITWAKDPIYKINLVGDLTDFAKLSATTNNGSIDPNGFLKLVNDITIKDYERLPMATFENLKDEIDPPFWVLVICIILAVPGSLLLAWFFDNYDLDAKVFGRSSNLRFRRY